MAGEVVSVVVEDFGVDDVHPKTVSVAPPKKIYRGFVVTRSGVLVC